MKIEKLWNTDIQYEDDAKTMKQTVKNALASDSNLRGSDLSDSDLRGSDLSGSDLRGSNLSGSDLRGSNLSDSDLSGSNLSGSDLSGTIRNGKIIKYATMLTGLYRYSIFVYITMENIGYIEMGCKKQSAEEWKTNFWNNVNEFPDNGSLPTRERQFGLNVALQWIDLHMEMGDR